MIAGAMIDAPTTGGSTLAATLATIVGPGNVHTDAATRALHSEDIWSAAPDTVALVVRPNTLDQLQQVMAAAAAAGAGIAPRGSGMSYTNGFTPTQPEMISVDLSAMDRIIAIRPDDMTVTVEAGCTWASLNAALSAQGLRTPFWGPMSGLASTVGGGISQLNAMFGAGHYGTSSESVVALTMVLADGSVLRTGAGGDTPFYRHFGPDLTGIFCGDAGVFGIKAEITLRLIQAPAHEDYAAFSFPNGAALVRAMAAMARAGIASEMCGFDPGLARVRMKRASLSADARTLGKVIGAEKSLGRGLMAAAKVALGGRNFIDEGDYSLNLIAEGRTAAGVAADIAEARRIALAEGAQETANTIARVIRAMPFPPLNSMLGPQGEAWVPVHGLVRLSDGPSALAAIEACMAALRPRFEANGIFTGMLLTTLSTNALLLEPVFYWPDARRPIHEVNIEAAHLARLPKLAEDTTARSVVAAARAEIIAIFAGLGAGHFQIGRTYPYRASRDAASIALLDALKGHLDPRHRLNPGGLGFPIQGD